MYQDELVLSFQLRHVDEHVDVVLVAAHVLVLDQPLDLLLDHLLGGKKHVLQNVDLKSRKILFQLTVNNQIIHSNDLNRNVKLLNLNGQNKKLLLSSLFRLEMTSQCDSALIETLKRISKDSILQNL